MSRKPVTTTGGHSMKFWNGLAAAAAVLLVCGPVAAADRKELHIYNWSD